MLFLMPNQQCQSTEGKEELKLKSTKNKRKIKERVLFMEAASDMIKTGYKNSQHNVNLNGRVAHVHRQRA